MKHIKTTVTLWLLCLFTVLPMGAIAQRTMTYSVNFSPSDFTIKKINGDTSVITSSKYDIYSNYDPTQPELPVIYVTFLLPPDMTYDSFTYTKTSEPYNNWLYYVINLLGDPEMPIYTGEIKQFHNAESIIYNDSLIISTGGVEDVFFAVNEPNNNMLYETRITSIHESDTIYVLETEEDSIQVALMKWNHVPRLFDIESHYYIQNRPNYNGDTKYENRTRPYLSIGRDVTNLKQFGNVNLVSGKTYSFKAKKEIQIKNGFSCPSGVGFTLDISNE